MLLNLTNIKLDQINSGGKKGQKCVTTVENRLNMQQMDRDRESKPGNRIEEYGLCTRWSHPMHQRTTFYQDTDTIFNFKFKYSNTFPLSFFDCIVFY